MRLVRLICLLCAVGAFSCATRPSSVSDVRALGLAQREFATKYPGTIEYYSIRLSDDRERHEWNVLFQGEGKYADPGGYILMRIDKNTGRLHIHHGQ
jgi:hypothetical protein